MHKSTTIILLILISRVFSQSIMMNNNLGLAFAFSKVKIENEEIDTRSIGCFMQKNNRHISFALGIPEEESNRNLNDNHINIFASSIGFYKTINKEDKYRSKGVLLGYSTYKNKNYISDETSGKLRNNSFYISLDNYWHLNPITSKFNSTLNLNTSLGLYVYDVINDDNEQYIDHVNMLVDLSISAIQSWQITDFSLFEFQIGIGRGVVNADRKFDSIAGSISFAVGI